MAFQHWSVVFFASVVLTSGVRVDDDAQATPALGKHLGSETLILSMSKGELNSDGTPRTIKEMAAEGDPEAIACLKDAEEAAKEAPLAEVEVSDAEIKLQENKKALDKFKRGQDHAKALSAQQLAASKFEKHEAERQAAETKLKIAEAEKLEAERHHFEAADKYERLQLDHDWAKHDVADAESRASSSAINAAAALKVVNDAKVLHDAEQNKADGLENDFNDATFSHQQKEEALGHSYSMSAKADNDYAAAKNAAFNSDKAFEDATLEYDKASAVHAKLPPIVTGLKNSHHAAEEALAIATDKAMVAAHTAAMSEKAAADLEPVASLLEMSSEMSSEMSGELYMMG